MHLTIVNVRVDETCENRNLNVMTENNGEDDDESLNILKIFIVTELSVTLYSTA